jgi:hypothetical protein
MAASIRVTLRSVTTADVRPARAPRTPEGVTSFRQVSWLAGRRRSLPSQALHRKAQWHFREGLTADSCGGSSGIDSPPKRLDAPDSLLADQRDQHT